MANAILIPGKEKRVYGGHPWVFRSDIARVEGDFTPGDIVSVYSSKGKFLAKAFYNPQSQISLRIMSLHSDPQKGPETPAVPPFLTALLFSSFHPITPEYAAFSYGCSKAGSPAPPEISHLPIPL